MISRLRDQLARLAGLVSEGPSRLLRGSPELVRTSGDLDAQFELIEAERLAINQIRETHPRS